MAAPVTPCPVDGRKFFDRDCTEHEQPKDECDLWEDCVFCLCCRRRLAQPESLKRGTCFYCKDHFRVAVTARSVWTA